MRQMPQTPCPYFYQWKAEADMKGIRYLVAQLQDHSLPRRHFEAGEYIGTLKTITFIDDLNAPCKMYIIPITRLLAISEGKWGPKFAIYMEKQMDQVEVMYNQSVIGGQDRWNSVFGYLSMKYSCVQRRIDMIQGYINNVMPKLKGYRTTKAKLKRFL